MTRPSCYSHSAPTTTPSPRTPPEIFDAVIDELASNRKDLASFDALLRCSLVSRQAYWRSRIHIFEEVNLGWTKTALTHQESQGLTCGTVFGLVELITHNPLLSERISSLRINPSFYYASSGRDNLCENLSTLLGQLPHLQRFALTSGSDPDAPSIPWSWFPAMVQSAIQVCCARPSIKGVEFRGFVGIPSTLLSSCSSSLTTLYISRAFNATVLEPGDLDFVDHALSGGPRKRPPWSLESLVCQNALPLLRSAIQHDSDPDESPFSGLQHLNVAVLTHDDSNLVAPLLGQSKDSIRKLEVSFTLWSGTSNSRPMNLPGLIYIYGIQTMWRSLSIGSTFRSSSGFMSPSVVPRSRTRFISLLMCRISSTTSCTIRRLSSI